MLDLVADISNIYTTPESSSFYDNKSFSRVELENGTVSLGIYWLFVVDCSGHNFTTRVTGC